MGDSCDFGEKPWLTRPAVKNVILPSCLKSVKCSKHLISPSVGFKYAELSPSHAPWNSDPASLLDGECKWFDPTCGSKSISLCRMSLSTGNGATRREDTTVSEEGRPRGSMDRGNWNVGIACAITGDGDDEPPGVAALRRDEEEDEEGDEEEETVVPPEGRADEDSAASNLALY